MNAYDLDVIFELLIKNSSTCSILVDLDGIIIRFNDAYKNLIGYSDEEIRSKAFAVYVSDDEYQREIGFINQLLNGEKTDIQFQSARLSKEGKVIPVEVTALLFTGKDNKPEFVLKRIEDISKKVETEELTRNNLFYLRTILDQVPLSIYFKDKNSRFLLNSRQHLNSLDCQTQEEAKGKTDFDFFHEVHAHKAFEAEQEIIRTGKGVNIEEKITEKDGNVKWGQTIKQPLKDPNGEIIGTYGITRDITVIKEAEEKMMALNKQLVDKNAQLHDTIEELSRTQNKLIFAEKMAALGNLIGGIAHEINTPLGAIKASSSNIDEVVEKIGVDLPWMLHNASKEEINWLFKLLTEADARDISVFSKEERQKKRALTSLFEDHHIENAPVVADTIVSLKLNDEDDSYLNFLKQPHAQRLLHILKILFSLKRNANNISVSVEKASTVVKALRSYIYKNISGDFEATDLSETLNTVLILTANMIKHSKTEVITHFETVPPIFCRQDEMCQVWTNLITNSIQAMGEGGTLVINLRHDKASYITISFKDSGPGIPDNIKPRIFEPYFTTKEKGVGTGMGLDISRQIIERHKGKIWFESASGSGTTFFVQVPIDQERHDTQPLNQSDK